MVKYYLYSFMRVPSDSYYRGTICNATATIVYATQPAIEWKRFASYDAMAAQHRFRWDPSRNRNISYSWLVSKQPDLVSHTYVLGPAFALATYVIQSNICNVYPKKASSAIAGASWYEFRNVVHYCYSPRNHADINVWWHVPIRPQQALGCKSSHTRCRTMGLESL